MVRSDGPGSRHPTTRPSYPFPVHPGKLPDQARPFERKAGLGSACASRSRISGSPSQSLRETHMIMGLAYNRIGYRDKALGCQQQALAIRKGLEERSGDEETSLYRSCHVETLINIGYTLGNLGQPDEAIRELEKAFALAESSDNRQDKQKSCCTSASSSATMGDGPGQWSTSISPCRSIEN